MLRRSVRSFVVVIALLYGALLSSACTDGRTLGITSSITLTSPSTTTTPSTPVVNTSGDDFQSVVISASPERASSPVDVSPDTSWIAKSWIWCKSSSMGFGVVFVRDDGQVLATQTPVACASDTFRSLTLGPEKFSARPDLLEFARGHTLTAEYGTIENGRDWTLQATGVRVWKDSLGIKFRVVM